MVSRLTGISPHVLRVWERRYGAVTAQRAENGRRMYTRQDVDRLLLLKHLVDRGDSIGQVADLDDEALRERGAAVRESVETREELSLQATVRVAVLGDFLPSQLRRASSLPGRIQIVSRGASVASFRADVRRLRPDALAIEHAVLDADAVQLVRELRAASGARRVVLLYAFAREADLRPLRELGVRTLRSPASLDEIFAALLDPAWSAAEPAAPEAAPEEADESADMSIPSRRFEPNELAQLASASTTVECECPKHLVDLVMSLSAFEAYSASCESRSPADAALHAYLHATTAQARARIEHALARVAEAEGLLDPGTP
jgi:DNA-binding transcriptional MerR regulator